MRKNVTLYIPTINRIHAQKTWDSLPSRWKGKNKTFLVCPENERKFHSDRGRNVLVHPTSCTHIGRVRQWIVENAKTKYILMGDDDLTFYARRDPRLYNLKHVTGEEMVELLEAMEDVLVKEKFSHCGMDTRPGNNMHFPAEFLSNVRVNNFHGFNRDILLKHNIRFDMFPLMEDFHVTLSLLELGYPNKMLTKYCWHQKGSNAAGGCSGYRTNELQKKAAEMLKARHPKFVTVVEKKMRKSRWNGIKTRTDVRVQWKKAHQSSFSTSQ